MRFLQKKLMFLFLAFLQKVSFCNFIRHNPRLFFACQRKELVIAVASFLFKTDPSPLHEGMERRWVEVTHYNRIFGWLRGNHIRSNLDSGSFPGAVNSL
jgi:hypothetical protein